MSSLTTLFASCQTATNNTLERFKTVDSSLQKSNSKLVDNVYTTMYEQIQAKKDKNPQLALNADTLFQATEAAFKLIETLKQKLNELDPSGTKLDIGSKVLINTAVAATLTNKLKAVYFSCTSSLVDNQQKIEAENIFSIAEEIKTNKNWTTKYFDKTPTVAVITILNKFRNDCLNLAAFSLRAIRDRVD